MVPFSLQLQPQSSDFRWLFVKSRKSPEDEDSMQEYESSPNITTILNGLKPTFLIWAWNQGLGTQFSFCAAARW